MNNRKYISNTNYNSEFNSLKYRNTMSVNMSITL